VMNKLLLLATSLFCLTLQGYAGIPRQGGASVLKVSIKDSSTKEQILNDPKDGF